MSEQTENTKPPEKNENQTNITNPQSECNGNRTIVAPTEEDVSRNENVGTLSVRLSDDDPALSIDGNPVNNAEERLASTVLGETVGDDFSKKSKVEIVCECEPNVAGAAVPAVKSFIPSENQSSVVKCNTSNCKLSSCDLKQTTKRDSALQKRKDIVKHVSRIRQKYREDIKEKSNSNNVNSKSKCVSHGLKRPDPDMIKHSKKPSLIPKPTGSSSISSKSSDCAKDGSEEGESVKLDTQLFVKSSNNCAKTKENDTAGFCTADSKVATEKHSGIASSNVSTISSKVLSLKEKLKATTSILRQKMEKEKSKEKTSPGENSVDASAEEEIDKNDSVPSNRAVDDLYKSIYSLKGIVTTISEASTLKSQTKYIEKLFSNISEIKLIADKLCLNDQSKSKQDVLGDSNSEIMEKEKSSTTNEKDNRIYIKFMHAKDRKGDKKKSKELCPDQSKDVQMTQEAINKVK